MSNTYFELKTVNFEQESFEDRTLNKVDCEMSLTAIVGGKTNKTIQMYINRQSGRFSGEGIISLTDDEAKKLANALLERVNGEISATGYEKSKF